MSKNKLFNIITFSNNLLIIATICSIMVSFSLLLTPTFCRAEMYVSAYFGANFGLATNPRWDARKWAGTDVRPQYAYFSQAYKPIGYYPPLTFPAFNASNIGVEPSYMVGGKFGYWFSRQGALSANYPDFMKYLGLELDISYNPLKWGKQSTVISPINYPMQIENNGNTITAAFLLMGRYGFMKDKEVPFGRLQPYLGIGPAILVTTTKLNIGVDYKSTEADIGFMVESGLRYMIKKCFSVNAEFKYRYARIHADVDDRVFSRPYWLFVPMSTTYNLFSLTVGVGYHF
ncbi:MAG: outer membrane protein [Thermodesulfobacteriota bacterium]